MNKLFEPLHYLIRILFPNLCISCGLYLGNTNEVICDKCFLNIPTETAFKCGGCKKRVPTTLGKLKACKCGFKFIFGAPGHYRTVPLSNLITELKYKGVKNAAIPLGKLLYKFILETKLDISNYIIIPIPLSKTREKARGYNQAELIAEELLVQSGTKPQFLKKDILRRIRNTVPQTTLNSHELRYHNLLGAFQAISSNDIKGKQILLIDDVTTSGATTIEAANALKMAGARKVVILTVTKA